MRLKVPEKTVVRDCLEYLHLLNIFAWRNNTGSIRTADNRFISFGLVGSSDILGCLNDGRLLAVECKSDTGKLSEQQKEFLEKVRKLGGLSIVARSYKDIEQALIANGYY